MQIFNITDSLSDTDLELLKNLNIDLEKIIDQYVRCSQGTIPANLVRVATLNDGITTFSVLEREELVLLYENQVDKFSIEKFVPASGAATRMFKFLIDFLKKFNSGYETINAYINKYHAYELNTFFIGLEKFSFYNIVLAECLLAYPNYPTLTKDEKLFLFVKVMLESDQLNFVNKPKALIPFHQLGDKLFTPITKHLKEAKATSNDIPKIHFTVSEGFEKDFITVINQEKIDCEVTFSNQMTRTNSIAFDLENKFFRQKNNELLFRPGGHGALIENLNHLESDIIFIKNIDNVSYNHLDEIVFNKKFIGGILIKHQQTIFNILNNFEGINNQESIIEILNYMEKQLNIFIPDNIKTNSTLEEIKLFIADKLNRPIRVCGMVKNEGEPGGGPFWIKNENKEITLQIVESSQVNVKNIGQQLILSQSTHFNPVDIVCGIKNHKGEKFDLLQHIDHSTGFIVQKSHEGRYLKAYELPGLWNGAMADWISIFVEVPIQTFNPVKTVNDLLKPAHQSE